jgi:hypothetical protein
VTLRHRLTRLEDRVARLAGRGRAAEEERLRLARELLAYQGSDPSTLARQARLIELARTIRRRRAEAEGRPHEGL